MKHTILFASAGLCWFGFACGGAPSGSSDGADGSGGPTWYPAQEASDDGEASDPETNIGVVTDDLSFSNWYLQLPTGSGHSPSTISASALSSGTTKSPYFYKASDGSGYIFMDPQHGITTSGSQHPRTEMHESGTWSSSGTNTMTASVKVNKVGNSGSVTIGQVFNNNDSITLGELEYSGSGRLKLFYEEAKGQGGSPQDLGVTVALGTKFTYRMALTKGKLTVQINGKQVYSHTPSSSILKKKFYFKYGTYDQTATYSSSPTTSVYTQAEFYSVSVTHN